MVTGAGQENPDVEPGGGDGLFDPIPGPDPLGDRLVPLAHEVVPEDLEYQDWTGRILNLPEGAIEGAAVPPPPKPTEPDEPALDEGWGYTCPPGSSPPPETGPEKGGHGPGPGTIPVVPVHQGLLPPQAQRRRLGGGAGIRHSGGSAGIAETQWCPVWKEIVTVSDETCKHCQYYQPDRADGDEACGYYAEEET
jgi:hypothetical protein